MPSRTLVRTARAHPQAAAAGAGVAGTVAVVSGVAVLVSLLRSRRVRRVAARSAERGVFGPGAATVGRGLHLVRDHEGTDPRDAGGAGDAAPHDA